MPPAGDTRQRHGARMTAAPHPAGPDTGRGAPRTMLSIVSVTLLKGLGSVLGLLIAMGIATLYGASAATDAYFLGRRVTSNLAMGLERAFHLLQVPPLVRVARNEGMEALRLRLSVSARRLLLVSLAATALGLLLAEPIVRLLAPGFDADRVDRAVLYFRILLLGMPISAVTALSGATLNALQLYSLPVLARLAPRLAILLALLLVPVAGFGLGGLAVATLLGTIVMGVAFGLAGRRVFARDHPPVVPAPAQPPPELGRHRIVAMLVAQFHIIGAGWIDIAFASTTGEGMVAAYDFAQRMVNMTPGLVTNSVVLVYYTHFAIASAERDGAAFRVLVRDSIRTSLFFILPLAVSLVLLGGPFIHVVLQHGRFTAEDARITAAVFAILALLMPINAVLGSLVSAIFADGRLPQLAMIAGSTALGLALRIGFDLAFVPRLGLVAVPVGALLSMAGILVMLWIWLSRHSGAPVRMGELRPFVSLALASALAGIAIWLTREAVLPAGDAGRLRMLAALGLSGAAGGLTFLLSAALTGLPEVRALTRRLARRLGRGGRR